MLDMTSHRRRANQMRFCCTPTGAAVGKETDVNEERGGGRGETGGLGIHRRKRPACPPAVNGYERTHRAEEQQPGAEPARHTALSS